MDLPASRAVVAGRRGFDASHRSRRRWLKDTAGVIAGLALTARGQAPSKSKERAAQTEVIDQVQAKARKAGLGEIGQTRSEHFVGLGDAPERFRLDALKLSEAVGRDFLTHFRGRGFKVAFPDRRMTVVTLKDSDSFKAYIGEDPEEVVAGQYELESDQLVMFDLRPLQGNLNADAKRVNTFALVHETIHLICFDTGLLSRAADVPRVISEGLATYGELWSPPHDAKAFGAINRPRLRAVAEAQNQGIPWIPMTQLLTDDTLFDKPETGQLAYAEAWLLVHYLLKQPQKLPKFQAYLAGLPKLGGAKGRVAYAEAQVGSLRALDQEVRLHLRQVLRR